LGPTFGSNKRREDGPAEVFGTIRIRAIRGGRNGRGERGLLVGELVPVRHQGVQIAWPLQSRI
jgi:hypothetical protein